MAGLALRERSMPRGAPERSIVVNVAQDEDAGGPGRPIDLIAK